MSWSEFGGFADGAADNAASKTGAQAVPADCRKAAEYIGLTALQLARRAHAAGFAQLAFLLECAALEAGAEAASCQCETDVSGS